MISRPEVWNHLFGHQGRLALDKGFASALREAGYLYQGNVEAVVREYLRFVYLDRVIPGGAVPSKAAQASGAAVGGIPGLPPKPVHAEGLAGTYEGTLAAYREEFGEPPTWFWPTPHESVSRSGSTWLTWSRAIGGLVMLAGGAGMAMGEIVDARGGFTPVAYASWMSLSTMTTLAGLLYALIGGSDDIDPMRSGAGPYTGAGSSDYGSVAGAVATFAPSTDCSVSDGGSSAGC